MKRVVVLRPSIIDGALTPGGTTLTVPDHFQCGPNFVLAPDPPGPLPPVPPNTDEQIRAMAKRITKLEADAIHRDATDREIVASLQKLGT